MQAKDYIPEQYWEALVGRRFDLREVGYPDLSLAFNRCLYHAMRDSVDQALRHLPLTADRLHNASVLDVGPGVGFWVEFWLAKGSGHITGIDLTAASVSRLRQKYPWLTFEQRNVADPIERAAYSTFDVISAMSILNHIPSQNQWEQALLNLGNLLKPNGALLIMDPILKHQWWGKPFDAQSNGRPRTIAEHASVLENVGVSIELVLPTVTILANPVDAKTRAEFRILEWWWKQFSRIARRERFMATTCGFVYMLDRALCRLQYMPSSKLLVCRKISA